jgi:ribose transport system permease protein
VAVRSFLAKYAVLIAMAVTFGIFGILKPDVFLSADNMRSILVLSAPLLITALGLTVVLVMGDFDLSFGAMIGLGGATAVVLINNHHVAWPVAVIVALLLGILSGSIVGLLTAYGGASAFIVTLGMSTILTGIEYAMTDQKAIYGNIPKAYSQLGQGRPFLGISAQFWIALVVTVIMYVFLERTETGRYMHATGGNPEAARLSGLAVPRLRLVGFVIVGLCAAIAGILITASSASSFPNSGGSYLLPSFAAAFLGSTVLRNGQFHVIGTFCGVLFLGIISTGLTLFQLSTSWINIVQGTILILSILVSRLERRH